MEAITQLKRGWRRWTASAVIFALVFHAALLLVHQPVSATPDEAAQDGTIVLCTAFGLKVVSLADLSGDAEPQNAPDKNVTPYCPICLGAQLAGTYVPPAAADLPQPSAEIAAIVFITPRFDFVVAREFISPLGPRAPPPIV